MSSFTYYCAFGYVSDDGSEINSSGNNSTAHMVLSLLDSPLWRQQELVAFSVTSVVVGQTVGTVAVGATMRGTVSGCRGTVTNEQPFF